MDLTALIFNTKDLSKKKKVKHLSNFYTDYTLQ